MPPKIADKYVNLLVVGESGLGKTTFIRNCFADLLNEDFELLDASWGSMTEFKDSPSVFCTHLPAIEVPEALIRLRYSVQDVPGYFSVYCCCLGSDWRHCLILSGTCHDPHPGSCVLEYCSAGSTLEASCCACHTVRCRVQATYARATASPLDNKASTHLRGHAHTHTVELIPWPCTLYMRHCRHCTHHILLNATVLYQVFF